MTNPDIFTWKNASPYELRPSESYRVIDFDNVEISPGIVNDTWFVTVSGTKPFLNMSVRLTPLVYIRQPEYWGIEVVGFLPGYQRKGAVLYNSEPLPLDGIRGTKGIEIIGSTKSEKREVPPR